MTDSAASAAGGLVADRKAIVTDRVAIVTGGAQGIGGATTEALLAHGARVCIADLDGARAKAIAARFGDERVLVVEGDLAEPEAPGRVVEATVQRFGQLDILVNNAGYYWDAPLHRMSDEQFLAMLEIHAVVPFRMMRAAAPHLREPAKREAAAGIERHRKVVNVSSGAAIVGIVGAANYAAGKAAVIGLTVAASREWAPLHINVNAVAFGPVQTRFGLPKEVGNVVRSGGHDVPLGANLERLRRGGYQGPMTSEEATDEAVYKPRRVPMTRSGRTASVQEAADAILYLCSPLSDMIHGQVLQVNM